MITTIIFDIGNVLTDFAWDKFLVFKGFDDKMVERIAKATVYDPIWNEIDRGVMSEEEILERFVANCPEMEAKIREIYENFQGLLKIFDYTIVTGKQSLQIGICCGIYCKIIN